MTGFGGAHINRNSQLETLAADLTLAAYRVALRTGAEGTWLELELALWRAMADTIKSWEREWMAAVPIAATRGDA